MSECSYQIDPRPAELGGGWRLRLIEDGEEVGGGVGRSDSCIRSLCFLRFWFPLTLLCFLNGVHAKRA